MEKEKILRKFGKEYDVNNDTFIMGINYLLGDHIAQRFKDYKVVLDVCCGAGFTSISLAKYVNQVIAVDVNPEHLKQAEKNVKIASVSSKIKFILGDILNRETLNKIHQIDGALLDPDWAVKGDVKTTHTSKLYEMQPPADKLFYEISKITQNIAIRLPREIDLSELRTFPSHELENIYLDNEFKFYCAYFGNLLRKVGETEFKIFS